MANFQWKERLKKVTDATTNARYVSERAKTIGMFFFYLFVLTIVLILLFLVIGLYQQNYYITATIVAIIGICGIVFLWKIIRADSLNKAKL